MLIFNCLPGEYSAAGAPTVTAAPSGRPTGESPLGPFDIQRATPLTDDSLYVGKLVRNPSGEWVLLAFHNIGADGDFVGALSDPMPVHWDGDNLQIAPMASTTAIPRLPLAAGRAISS